MALQYPFQAVLEALIKARQAPPASAYAANALSTGLGAYNTANEQRMKNEQLNRANLVDLNKAYLAQKYTPTVPTNGQINMQGLGGVGGQFGIPGVPSGLPTATSTPTIAQPEQLMGGSNVTWNKPEQTQGRLLIFDPKDGSYSTEDGNQVYDYDKTRDTIRNLAIPQQAMGRNGGAYVNFLNENAKGKVIQAFNADTAVKKYQQSIDAAGQIRDLALSGNPIAAGAIPTYSARMSGEVGNLSEPDKKPFGGSRAIDQRLKATFAEWSTGQLSPDNKQFIINLTNIIEKRQRELLRIRAEKYANQYGSVPNLYGSPEEINTRLNPNLGNNQIQSVGVPAVGSTDERGTIKSIKRIK